VLTAVKKAEDAEWALIFRVYEWAGKETTAEFPCAAGRNGSATVANLMSGPRADMPLQGGKGRCGEGRRSSPMRF